MWNNIYNFLLNKQNKKYNDYCSFCNNYIILKDSDPYLFKIIGLGKHDKKIICVDCLLQKIAN